MWIFFLEELIALSHGQIKTNKVSNHVTMWEKNKLSTAKVKLESLSKIACNWRLKKRITKYIT